MALELGRVTDRKPPFKYSALTRVGFSDTDAQGIVYYGRYLPYFDTARVEYLRHLGRRRHDGDARFVEPPRLGDRQRMRRRHAGPAIEQGLDLGIDRHGLVLLIPPSPRGGSLPGAPVCHRRR